MRGTPFRRDHLGAEKEKMKATQLLDSILFRETAGAFPGTTRIEGRLRLTAVSCLGDTIPANRSDVKDSLRADVRSILARVIYATELEPIQQMLREAFPAPQNSNYLWVKREAVEACLARIAEILK